MNVIVLVGVILVNTPSIDANKRFFAMRKAVKGFADSMLDLIVEDSTAGLVDRFGKQELIYLGPDEQIIPSDIDWITQRAAERGYPIPAAFMSSKKVTFFIRFSPEKQPWKNYFRLYDIPQCFIQMIYFN